MIEWSNTFVERLNTRLQQYCIDELRAELDLDSKGEKVNVHFPRAASFQPYYQLDYLLLEFGGRNRGRPTQRHNLSCYLSEVSEVAEIGLPISTQTKVPVANRLARHWYNVDCLLQHNLVDLAQSVEAMRNVVAMKAARWASPGVDYHQVLKGGLQLIPSEERLVSIVDDHRQAINGGLFFFATIIERLRKAEMEINTTIREQG